MLTFDTMDGGMLAAQFKRALQEIGRNIMDPNTDPEATRGMTINIKFKPSGTGTIDIQYEVKPKLAGAKKAKTTKRTMMTSKVTANLFLANDLKTDFQ